MSNYKQDHLKEFTKTGSLQPRMNLSINNTNNTMQGYNVQVTRQNGLISQNLGTYP